MIRELWGKLSKKSRSYLTWRQYLISTTIAAAFYAGIVYGPLHL